MGEPLIVLRNLTHHIHANDKWMSAEVILRGICKRGDGHITSLVPRESCLHHMVRAMCT